MRHALSLLTVALIAASGCSPHDAEPAPPAGYGVLAAAHADLDGDGRKDLVRLVGRGGAASLFREDLSLLVGSSPDLIALPGAAAAGYGPTLELTDVTGDGAAEVVLVADTGGSGGMVAAAVMQVRKDAEGWDLQAIFDSESGPRPVFGGSLENGFEATLVVTAPGGATQRRTLDLTGRRDTYLQLRLYDAEGELQRPVDIWGNGLISLHPLDPTAGSPGLRLLQQARGASNADRLAEIQTDLIWQDAHWQTHSLHIHPLD